jgi:molybdate transport system ATP-binding protein
MIPTSVTNGWLSTKVGNFSLDVAWNATPGEVLVFYGPSGAGKSLTLKGITGLLKPQCGKTVLAGTVVADSVSGYWVPPHKRSIGYVPQNYGLFPHLTVEENIAYGLWRWPSSQVRERVDVLLESFQLKRIAVKRPGHLSGGEQQRVAIARAMAPEPKLLLLDEPFSALDAELRRSLREDLRSLLSSWNVPIILVTHDREEALALGHWVLVMDSGRVVAEGAPLSILEQPPTALLARLVGVENLYRGRVLSRSTLNGTMLCDLQGVHLEVPLVSLNEDMHVTVGIRAKDILLANRPPNGISARNVLEGRIVSVIVRSPAVEVVVECGITIKSWITQEAVEELSLKLGTKVWVVLKASSCFLVADHDRV